MLDKILYHFVIVILYIFDDGLLFNELNNVMMHRFLSVTSIRVVLNTGDSIAYESFRHASRVRMSVVDCKLWFRERRRRHAENASSSSWTMYAETPGLLLIGNRWSALMPGSTSCPIQTKRLIHNALAIPSSTHSSITYARFYFTFRVKF